MNSEYAKERAGLSQGNISGLSAPTTKTSSLVEQISDLAQRLDTLETQAQAVSGRLFGYEDAPADPTVPVSPPGVLNETERLIGHAHRQINRVSDCLIEINRRI